MALGLTDTFAISINDIIALADAFKPSQWETVLAATAPAYISSFFAWYLYNKQRKDKNRDKQIEKDNDKILNLNLLLMNLFQCIENQKDNLSEVNDYKKKTRENYKQRTIYVFKDECHMDDVVRISNQLIVDLPEVSYDLNRLKDDLFWAKKYREQRDSCTRQDYYSFYKDRLDLEAKQEILIIKRLTAICLVLYDYATNLFPKNRILKITAKTHIAQIWQYLIDDPNFNETKPFSRLQYEFKNPAIKEWFFVRLKNQYLEDSKNNSIS